jgi:topoisomerase-4 subunit B
MVRSKAYLFSGVEIRWKSAIDDGETPTEATFHFPGGLSDYLTETIGAGAPMPTRPLPGRSNSSPSSASPAPSNGRSTGRPRATASSSPTATPCPRPRAARTRPASGPRSSRASGLWRTGGQQESRQHHPRRPHQRRLRARLLLHRGARVCRPDQGPPRHDRGRPHGRGRRARPFRQLARRQHQGRRLHPRFPRPARRGTPAPPRRKGNRPQIRHQEAAPARQTGRLLATGPRRDGALHRRGRLSGRLRQDGAQPQDQALLPLRGKILNVLGAASSKLGQNAEISDLCQALGVGMGTQASTSRICATTRSSS